MEKITFNPALVTKKLLNPLDQRPRDVLVARFGLRDDEPQTLESIGRKYGITRERVRQIEAFALNRIRKSDEFSVLGDVFSELKVIIDRSGWVVQEEDFLSSVASRGDYRPHILFLLVVGDDFYKVKKDEHVHSSWTTDNKRMENIRKALQLLHEQINNETLFSEKELLAIFEKHLTDALREKVREEVIYSLIKISRLVAQNALGEWGAITSPFIKPRGMRDYAFLVMRKHGSPMHFSETANAIKELFGRPAHIQTVHNEVIKDDRFVLVGRGLYALREWGYEGGVVKKVIEKILSDNGPLPKEEIVKRVLKERYVKENTILVNLQNRNFFKKDKQGNYFI